MPKRLASEEIEHYEREGYVFPVRVLEDAAVAHYTEAFADYERQAEGVLQVSYKHKMHLVAPWAADLVREPAILDAVEDLLGPDLLVWTTNLLAKDPGDRPGSATAVLALLASIRTEARTQSRISLDKTLPIGNTSGGGP